MILVPPPPYNDLPMHQQVKEDQAREGIKVNIDRIGDDLCPMVTLLNYSSLHGLGVLFHS